MEISCCPQNSALDCICHIGLNLRPLRVRLRWSHVCCLESHSCDHAALAQYVDKSTPHGTSMLLGPQESTSTLLIHRPRILRVFRDECIEDSICQKPDTEAQCRGLGRPDPDDHARRADHLLSRKPGRAQGGTRTHVVPHSKRCTAPSPR